MGTCYFRWILILFSAEGIIISDAIDLNNLTVNNAYIINNSNCANFPPNNFTLGKLFVQKSTYGIRQIFFNDNSNTTYIRNYNNGWTSWQQVYPDYSSISLQINGYIVFTSGLILQWRYNNINAFKGNNNGIYNFNPPIEPESYLPYKLTAFCVPNRANAAELSFECIKNMKVSWPIVVSGDGRNDGVYLQLDRATGEGGLFHIIFLSW